MRRIAYALLFGIAVFFGVMFRDQLKKKKALNDFIEHSGKHLIKVECSNAWFIQNIWIVLLCIAIAIYIYLNPGSVDKENVLWYVGTTLLLASVFAFYVISEKKYQDLYMNRDSFYHNGNSYRFTSVKSIVPSSRTYKLTTQTGDTLNVNVVKAQAIQEQIDKRKK